MILRIVLMFAVLSAPLWADCTEDYNFALGQLAFKDYYGAVDAFTEFIESCPNDKRIATAYYNIGECQFRLEDYAECITAEEAALAAHPDAAESANGSYYLGRSHMALKQFGKAHAGFARATNKEAAAEIRELSMVLDGECLIKIEDYVTAATVYADFLDSFPDSKHRPDIMFSQGWTFNALKEHEQAVTVLKEFLATHGDHALANKACLALSDALSALGLFDEAGKAIEAYGGQGADDQEASLRLAWNLFSKGEFEKAAVRFIAYADKFPDDRQAATALYNAGICYYELKQFDKTIVVFRRIQKDFPDSKEAGELRFWLAMSLFETKAFEEAGQLINTLLESDDLPAKKVSSLIYTMAATLVAQNQPEQAIPWFNRLADEYPESEYADNALYSCALAQERTEKVEDAVGTLKKLLETYPDTELATQANFALAEFLYGLGRFPKAAAYLQAIADTGDPRVIYRLGWTQFEEGQYEAAIQQFKVLTVDANEFHNEALYMCGRCHENLSQASEAILFYEQLKQIAGDGEFIEKAFHRLAFLYDSDLLSAHLAAYRERFPQGEFGAVIELKAAELCFSNGDIDCAVTKYQALEKQTLQPELAESVLYGLAWCYRKQDDLPQADAYFAKVEGGDFTKSLVQDAILQRGEIAYHDERYDPAIAFLVRLVDLQSNRGERANYMLGWCHRRLDNLEVSMPYFKAIVERFPDSEFRTDSAIRLGAALYKLGQQDSAREVLQTALKDGADEVLAEELSHLYAEVLVATNDWETLIDLSAKMETQFDGTAKAYLVPFRLGLAYKGISLYEKAIEQFDETKAMTETIEAAQAQFNIGSIYFAQQKYKKAGNAFLKVETLYDYADLSPKALYHAIRAFIKVGGKNVQRAELYHKKMQNDYGASEWTQKAAELFTDPQAGVPPGDGKIPE